MQQHRVTLMGREFRIRSESDEEHISAVAEYVNEKIADLSDGKSGNVSQGVLLLAALNMADEVFQARARNTDLKDRIRAHSRTLLQRMGHQETSAQP